MPQHENNPSAGRRMRDAIAADDARDATSERWEHLKQYGYAPGGYLVKCHTCNQIAEFVDKRAICCRPCAEAKHSAAEAAPQHVATITGLEQPTSCKFAAGAPCVHWCGDQVCRSEG